MREFLAAMGRVGRRLTDKEAFEAPVAAGVAEDEAAKEAEE